MDFDYAAVVYLYFMSIPSILFIMLVSNAFSIALTKNSIIFEPVGEL